MKTLFQLSLAGLAGFAALKVLGGLILPALGIVAGTLMLVAKIGLILLVGWLVVRALRGRRRAY